MSTLGARKRKAQKHDRSIGSKRIKDIVWSAFEKVITRKLDETDMLQVILT